MKKKVNGSHTLKTKAWITSTCLITPQDLAAGRNLDYLQFSSGMHMKKHGWTYAGDAVITVTPLGAKELVESKVDALREEAKSIRAEATAKVTRIESQIQNLLAISYDGATQS